MTTTDTPSPLPALEPAPGAWLPLTAADVAAQAEERQPEHDWPGSLFIFLTNLVSFGMGVGAVVAFGVLVESAFGGSWARAGLAASASCGLALGCILQRTLAQHVSRFTRWGWYGAMGELAVVALAKANTMVTTGTVIMRTAR